MRLLCVDVCELLGVSRREVRPDVTRSRRACVRVRRFVRKNPPTFCQLQQARMRNCPLRVRDARDQHFQHRTLRAAQSHRYRVPTVLSED